MLSIINKESRQDYTAFPPTASTSIDVVCSSEKVTEDVLPGLEEPIHSLNTCIIQLINNCKFSKKKTLKKHSYYNMQ